MDTVTIIYIQRQNKRKINGLKGVEYIFNQVRTTVFKEPQSNTRFLNFFRKRVKFFLLLEINKLILAKVNCSGSEQIIIKKPQV